MSLKDTIASMAREANATAASAKVDKSICQRYQQMPGTPPAGFLQRARALAAQYHYSIIPDRELEPCMGGNSSATRDLLGNGDARIIRYNASYSPAAVYETLAHELTHVVNGHTDVTMEDLERRAFRAFLTGNAEDFREEGTSALASAACADAAHLPTWSQLSYLQLRIPHYGPVTQAMQDAALHAATIISPALLG